MTTNEPIQYTQPPPKIHGVIIGINKYKRPKVHPDLLGCVSDAHSMLRYFVDLGVPEDHFLCLYDERATRQAILNAFVDHLINNSEIKWLDPIVIYFAGHGDRMPAPPGWQTPDGFIEMILPHDASTWDNGYYTYGIPDLTLAFLLYKLSQAKGNNITVIFDSCHSGSGTRGEVRSRSSHDSDAPAVPDKLDVTLRQSLSVDYPTEVEHNITGKHPAGALMAPSLESHVLLAACREHEQAQEVSYTDEKSGSRSGGLFTDALLKELKKSDLTTTSYTSLIRKLLTDHRPKVSQNLRIQTFQCEGRNQDRLLFSVQFSHSKGRIGLIPTSDKLVYRVRIGSAQGVVPGTEFGVYTSGMLPSSLPITTLIAKDVGPIVSQLYGREPNAPPDIPTDAYATILKYNDHSNGVRIWVDEEIKQNEFWKTVLAGLDSLPIFWATSRENHDVELLLSDGHVELRGAHLTPGQFGSAHILKYAPAVNSLIEMLSAIVYFHFHLKSQNKEAPIRRNLGIALRQLKVKDRNWGSPIYEVGGEDLFGDSVPAGTVASLHADPDKVFGLELINNSRDNLYPYVLYYDFEDYSVGCLYEPPSRSGRPPLSAGSSITVGYGSSGSLPFQVDFTNPKSDKEYGAFVMLVFSEWVDIGYLQQESPLTALSFEGRGERRGHFESGIWDSLLVRVELVKEK
ncbi:unnamed protein product [Rhizoctonia solani]|uniref:Peptidase C14 caspase domain-containing protein n=1 Tax=Rhizoctonia solani TaxID=456999 RepID=A0A8H3CGI5_9AGAM|nr:unnamed protein product [Rhizoctonia solani]